MKRLFLSIIVLCFSLILSCNENPAEINDISNNWYDNAKIEAVNNPDITVQLFIDTLPTFNSWNIYRIYSGNIKLITRMWGQCYYDSCVSLYDSIDYRIEILNDSGVIIKETQIKSKPWTNEVLVGLILPNDDTKWIEGEQFSVMWNPESFPDTTVTIIFDYHKGGGTITGDILQKIENNGRCFYICKNHSGTTFINIKINPTNNSSSSYTYTQHNIDKLPPTPSHFVTFPALKDSVKIGLSSFITWNKTVFSGNIEIRLYNEAKIYIVKLGNSDNSGEFVWSVPNVNPAVYYISIKEESAEKSIWSFPFYIIR